MDEPKEVPSWRYGPGEQAEIFYSAKDVPAGWEDHPSKVKGEAEKPKSPLTALRNEYKALTGKKPSPRLDAEALSAKLADLKAAS